MERRVNSSSAYIIYRSGTKGRKARLFFNDEAHSILFQPIPGQAKPSPAEILTLCSKWTEILNRRQDDINGLTGEELKQNGWKNDIDIFQSWRRKYTVRGIPLTEQTPLSGKKGRSYLFIIERFRPESLNLTAAFRNWNLNHREQEIVRLILRDYGNKEIAKHLGISINTVKAYMKLLLRKVGVHTRAGVISTLLSGKEGI